VKSIVEEPFLVSSYFMFFLIHASQVGVGILKFPSDIISGAGHDAWISVLLCGLTIHILVWMMFRTLKIANNDLVYINQYCFGEWIGGLFNLMISLYFFCVAFIVFRSYIEVVQVWIFPYMKTWQISIVFLVLIYYIVTSGFRVITGINFFGVIIPFFVIFPLIFFPLEFAHFENLFPLFQHSIRDIWVSSKTMLFQFLGFETLFMYYPFIKNPQSSQKWAHFGVLFTTLLYLLVTIITFVYFSQAHLKHLSWPTLSLLKIVEWPLIERFEYIVVSLWLMVVLPNISLSLWSACRGVKKVIHIKQRIILIMALIVFFLLANVISQHQMIKQLTDAYSNVALYFVYVYIPFMFIIMQIKQKC
jgi:spore germination protein (amino acid permease)